MAPKSLVEKTPCLIYILADVIDRNNLGGVDILKWLLLQPNAQLILGNHEQMLLSNRWVFQEISDESIDNIEENNIELLKLWESNGAECTIKALTKESAEMRRDILEYLDECPLKESLIVNNRKCVLVHAVLEISL